RSPPRRSSGRSRPRRRAPSRSPGSARRTRAASWGRRRPAGPCRACSCRRRGSPESWAWWGPSAVERRDGLDLDERVGDREVSDLHQRAGGRIGPEELRAHLAVRLAIPDVGDEDGDLHHVVHLAAARLDDHLDLLEDAARLRLDVALAEEVAILVERQLARDVDVVAHAPAERVAWPLILHAGRSDRNAGHDESPLLGKPRVPIRAESSTGLARSLDNVLELLAERWIVGVLRAVLRQGLDCEIRSHLQELHDSRRRFGFLTSPGIRGGEVCPGAPERLTGCRRALYERGYRGLVELEHLWSVNIFADRHRLQLVRELEHCRTENSRASTEVVAIALFLH